MKRAEVSLCEMRYRIEELGARECIDKAKSCETIAERIILLETELKMKEKRNYYLRERNVELSSLIASSKNDMSEEKLTFEGKDEVMRNPKSYNSTSTPMNNGSRFHLATFPGASCEVDGGQM